MEEHRCKMTASASTNCRCTHLLDSAVADMRDPRYEGLASSAVVSIEDSRCILVCTEIDDPRCQGISSIW